MKKMIRYGMVGGDLHAFIGDVHRKAIAFDCLAELTAGCFSTNEVKNKETGEFYHLCEDRIYANYQEMAEKEASREDKIHFVCITTPNATHYAAAKAFLLHGIHVVCEKPLCFEIEQALELERLAKEHKLLFGVAYSYSGNPMVKFAKELVEQGELGKIINVSGQYLQEWLIDDLGEASSTSKMSVWRADPKAAGISNCVGDIGSHIENTVQYITGLKIKRVAARLDYYGHELDLNANILIEYDNGAVGNYSSSQVAIGHTNDLGIRIFGTEGAIEWREETPNDLMFTKKGQPPQIFSRGNGYMKGRAAEVSRIPAGHPEGYYESFANFYRTFITAISKLLDGKQLDKNDLDFPSVADGIEGVKFIHAVVESGKKDSQWVCC